MIGSRTKMAVSSLAVGVLLASSSLLPAASANPVSASAPSPTSAIAKNAYGYVNTIRNYFFCVSATCKKAHAANEIASGRAMQALVTEARALSAKSVPAEQKAAAMKFAADVAALSSAYIAYPKESSAQAIARNTASIYYQSANVGSDAYLLSVPVKGGTVHFAQWCVGAVAVLYAMQLDTQALNAKTATAADALYASRALQSEAATLAGDANGPSTTFNALLKTFARTQLTVSSNEVAILEHKKPSLSTATLSALSTMLGQQFTQIVTMERSLAKK
jgi:hypothetical protein